MPSSGEDTPYIGEELFRHVPIWMTALLFIFAAIGLTATIVFLSRLISQMLSRRV